MTSINFGTDKLIIMHYPLGAGGKFIQMVMGLHPKVMFQNQILTKIKMKRDLDTKTSFDIVMKTFDKKLQSGRHVEFGCDQLAGFSSDDIRDDIEADEKLGNDTWIELTNQEKFYFFMTEHGAGNHYRRYTKRKVIKLENFEWILQERRGITEDTDFDGKPTKDPQSMFFDMETVRSPQGFVEEIHKAFEFLGIENKENKDKFEGYVEQLRETFLRTFRIGFEDQSWFSDKQTRRNK